TAADQRDDLQNISGRDRGPGLPGPRHQVPVELDGDMFRLDPEVPQQLGHGLRPGYLTPLAVHGDLHDRSHPSSPVGATRTWSDRPPESPNQPISQCQPLSRIADVTPTTSPRRFRVHSSYRSRRDRVKSRMRHGAGLPPPPADGGDRVGIEDLRTRIY